MTGSDRRSACRIKERALDRREDMHFWLLAADAEPYLSHADKNIDALEQGLANR